MLKNNQLINDYASPKEIAKNLIIRILYGGDVDKWMKAWEIKSNY